MSEQKIFVTKTFMPPIEEYEEYLQKIWRSGQITNQGPLVKELEGEISQKFSLQEVHFVANGTLALQLAVRALSLSGSEIITTPFSYVATVSSILWEHCTPIFVDIDPETFCIDAQKIEQAITPNTKAIMAVHVFGNPCDVETIQQIAQKHNLRVIYDGAHAFGVSHKGKSLLSYGDISTCSFHATKLFHTVEGGCVVVNDRKISKDVELMKRFGHEGDEHRMLGINAKSSEFHAAMGLTNLKHLDEIITAREEITRHYDNLLATKFERPKLPADTSYNYAYYPVLFSSEAELDKKMQQLADRNIFPRRYFYPSLNKLPYLDPSQQNKCPISEDIATRIICLPLYVGLPTDVIDEICEVMLS